MKLVLKDTTRTKTSLQQRQRVLSAFHAQFVRIYASHADVHSRAITAARDKEDEVHRSASSATYASDAAASLVHLRKLPVQSAESINVKDSVLDVKHLEPFILPLEQLEELDFPRVLECEKRELPVVKSCDRCSANFFPKALRCGYDDDGNEDPNRTACRYHWGRLVSGQNHGEKERRYTCCLSGKVLREPNDRIILFIGVGELGCMQGPHVYCYRSFEEAWNAYDFVSFSRDDNQTNDQTCTRHDCLALDGEMAFTTDGLELIRLSVVDADSALLMDVFVQTTGSIRALIH